MNIIFGTDNLEGLDSKYTVLELDSIKVNNTDGPVVAYCLIESIPINEMVDLDHYRDLHSNLIKNYRLGNWKYCEDAIEHLVGKWNRELDSFYADLSNRIQQLKQSDIPEDWDGTIDRTTDTDHVSSVS